MNPIQQLVAARRRALAQPGLPRDETKIWGLALSGGGIRSATFCFGLLRALARRELLLRFDLLSTVSGGGYIGATLGRLFSRATAAEVRLVAAAFADASSRWFAWWLRANGRYLIPSGTKDRTYAIALYLRNLVAIHFELGILAILLGTVLALIDIAGWSLLAHLGYTDPELVFTAARYLPDWLPVIAFLLPLVAIGGCVIAIEYWCVPWLVRSGTISPGFGRALLGRHGRPGRCPRRGTAAGAFGAHRRGRDGATGPLGRRASPSSSPGSSRCPCRRSSC